MANRAVKLPTWKKPACIYVTTNNYLKMNFKLLLIEFWKLLLLKISEHILKLESQHRLGEHFVHWLAFCRAKSNTFAAMTCLLIDCIINFVLNLKRQAIHISCMSCQLIWQFLMKVTHNEVFCKLRFFLWFVIKASCLVSKR